MRDYGKVSPRFWIGKTGKAIRAEGANATIAAMYLLTAPGSNMTGLYYLPLVNMQHETGLSDREVVVALAALGKAGFAYYDAEHEVVWVVEMAKYQIAETLKAEDKRVQGVINEIAAYRDCRFYRDFVKKYAEAFHLPSADLLKGLPRASEAPSKALRSQEQEQEQEQDLLAARGAAPAKTARKQEDGPSVEPLRLRLLAIVRENGRPYVEKVAAERTQLKRALQSPGVTPEAIEAAFRAVYARNFFLRIEQVALALTKAQEARPAHGRKPEVINDPQLVAALARAERGEPEPGEADAEPDPGDGRDGSGVRGSPPIPASQDPLAPSATPLSSTLRALLGPGRQPRELQDAARVEPRVRHG